LTTFNVLAQESEILGKKILEASAGTGKTFAIEHIVLRLLLENDTPLTIDQILVVTFTKAATKELKFRIRENIENAIQFLEEKNTNNEKIFEYLKPFLGKKDPLMKLHNAIALFETAQIFTIHSFCFKALKEFALDADVLINLEEENESIQIIRKIIYDYLKYSIDPKEFSSEQIEILVAKNKGIEILSKRLHQFYDKNLASNNLKTFSEFQKSFQSKIKAFEKVEFNEIAMMFEETSNNYKKLAKFRNDNFVEQIQVLVDLINEKQCSEKDFKRVIKNRLSFCEFLAESNKKIKAKNFILPSIFKKISQLLYPIIKDATDSKSLFYRLLDNISSKIDQHLESEEILTFDKILSKMRRAINNPHFRIKIQKRYKAAIIDEFQDTDPIQFEIFERLFLSNENILAFYLIGDPKQSIYSFRKADLYTYLSATKKLDQINYLDTNYRSSKSLIDSLNALFSENFSKNWLKLPQIKTHLKYLPIKSGLNKDFDFKDDFAPLHFFIAEDKFRSKKWPTEKIEKMYFSFITKEILRLKTQGKFCDDNFAVLVKDRYQAQRIKSYFQKHSIKVVTAKATSLKNSRALNALQQFIEATLSPFDLNKIKIALKGPYLQSDDEKIRNIDLEKQGEIINNFLLFKISIIKGSGLFFLCFFCL